MIAIHGLGDKLRADVAAPDTDLGLPYYTKVVE